MTKYLAAYAATLAVMLVLDILWIGVIAKPLYQQGIGHLMAEQPRLGIAVGFYLMYAAGLVVFAVQQGGPGSDWRSASRASASGNACASRAVTSILRLKRSTVAGPSSRASPIDIHSSSVSAVVCDGSRRRSKRS